MAIADEVREKERRVREFLRAKGLRALLLKRQANFSWLTAGGLNLVGITTEVGAASLLVTETGKYVITNNIEAPRMAAEENLEAQGYEIRSYPWYEEREADLVAEIVGAGALGCDVPFPRAVALTEEIARLRYSLTADGPVGAALEPPPTKWSATGGWGSGSPRRSRIRWPQRGGGRRSRRWSAGSATNSGRTGSIPSP